MVWFYTCYLPLINLAAFLMMCADKRRARRGKRRIPERTLFGAALLGGCLGGLLGMYFANHKTRHRLFAIGLPVLTVVYTVLLALLWWYR
ncbi:MAG: DUF1294 domain-containing protein [Oscillospiraceae bacterium]|nr:DUF1294 domain-containing protein [Oscillospiraceae bacterium]